MVTRRRVLAGLGASGLGVAAGIGAGGCGDDEPAATATTRADRPRSAPSGPPNVVLVVADDMRLDWLQFTPSIRRLVGEAGRTFTQARCNVPLCQPSRVGLFTGQTSRHNGELGVGNVGVAFVDHDNTLGKWVADAGYDVGLFGKYVNFYDGLGGVPAPAGYTWREYVREPDTEEMVVHDGGAIVRIDGVYPTDYWASEAIAFIEAAANPFFCILTPYQPHAPFRPRADLANAFADLEWPAIDDEDVTDKPPWIRDLPRLTNRARRAIREHVIGAARELAAVDEMVARVLDALRENVLANTVVIFTSDNGVHLGEHRRSGDAAKAGPYDVGMHVPLLIRGPGVEPGPDVDVPSMAMQDVTATIVEVTGATPGLPHQAGVSLRELCRTPDAYVDRLILHEIGEGFYEQTGDGLTTGPRSRFGFRKLFRYPSVRANPAGPFVYEAYDLDTDPHELSNWADDPARRAERDALEAELVALLSASARLPSSGRTSAFCVAPPPYC